MAAAPAPQPAVFGSPALDQAVAGVTAGIVSTFALQPLDLLKVQLQVSTAPKTRGTLGNISWGLREIVRTGGARALYRGLTPNLVGNASSWGSYFLWSVHLSPCIARADLTLLRRTRPQVHDAQGAHGRRQGPQAERRPAPPRVGHLGCVLPWFSCILGSH